MTTAWIVLGLVGAGLLLVTFVADTFEVDVPGTDAGLPAEAIAGFLTASGLIGWLLSSTGATTLVTVPVAVGSGIGMGAVTVALVRALMRTPTDATPVTADFVGAIGRVVTPIADDRIGEVMLRRHGQPWKVTAELADGDTVAEVGSQVVVVATRSATRVVVTPTDL